MNFPNQLNIFIPLYAFGAILMASLYHSALFYINKKPIIFSYCLFLWSNFVYLVASLYLNYKGYNQTTEIIKLTLVIFYWLNLFFYQQFFIKSFDTRKFKHAFLYFCKKNTWILFPICFIIHIYLFKYEKFYIKYLIVFYYFSVGFIFCYAVALVYSKKVASVYIIVGSLCIIISATIETVVLYYEDSLLGLNGLSYFSIGVFFQIVFFSMFISEMLKKDQQEKSMALEKLELQKIQLVYQKEREMALESNISIKLELERNKAILKQRELIGKKLEQHLLGDLLILKDMIGEYKFGNNVFLNNSKINEIELEVNNIYNDIRDYSHFLLKNNKPYKNC